MGPSRAIVGLDVVSDEPPRKFFSLKPACSLIEEADDVDEPVQRVQIVGTQKVLNSGQLHCLSFYGLVELRLNSPPIANRRCSIGRRGRCIPQFPCAAIDQLELRLGELFHFRSWFPLGAKRVCGSTFKARARRSKMSRETEDFASSISLI